MYLISFHIPGENFSLNLYVQYIDESQGICRELCIFPNFFYFNHIYEVEKTFVKFTWKKLEYL